MKFLKLAEYFEKLQATSKRLEMFDILSDLYTGAGADEVDIIVYLSQGQLLPPFSGVEIGVSDKLLLRALAEASGTASKKAAEVFGTLGDIGLTAETLLDQRTGGELSVVQVYSELMAAAEASGPRSVERKIGLLADLFRGVTASEAKFIARFVAGRLRLGIGDPTVLEALAIGSGGRELKPGLERAYNLCSDLGLVAKTLKTGGLEAVTAFGVRPGYPIRPALCERVSVPEEITAKMGNAAVEAKYDGFRVQCHKFGGRVEFFSRNLERTTEMFPEVAAAVQTYVEAETAILEGEAIAFNEETGELLPFQETIKRKRKHDVEGKARELPLRFFAFDLLYLDGTDYTPLPFAERRARLESVIRPNGVMEPSSLIVTAKPEQVRGFFEEMLSRGLEGIVAKRTDAPYSAGARNFNWIKLKRSYRGELNDTVDLCVIGYYRGKGNRAKLGIGGLLGAVYDPLSDTFKTITRIGSGFSEQGFSDLKTLLDGSVLPAKSGRVDSDMNADVWVEPKHIVTVRADEITRSPSHTAGRDGDGTGYALRFPRAEGGIREDKRAEDASTVQEIISMYNRQRQVGV